MTTITRKLSIIALAMSLQWNVNAQSGQALDFVASLTNYVELGNISPSGSYTREVWIYARNFSFANNIFSGTRSAFWAPNGALKAGHFDGNTNIDYWAVGDVNNLLTNTWYHVAITFDASTNVITLYKNGVAISTNTTVPYAETNLFIGTYNYGVHSGVGWDGLLDEVRLWNVVRTPAQIAANYNCALTGDEPGLVAYYDFEQGIAGQNNSSVTTLFDRSDKCTPNNGTLTNFTLNGSTSNWVTPGRAVSSCGGSFVNIGTAGNSTCITDGDNTPSLSDFTDFGVATPVTRTFTIQNTGNATLTISGVAITGAGAGDFSITSPPAASVPAGGSTTLRIQFTASSNGTKNAVVTINNNDPDEGAYDFAIRGSFLTLPVELKSFSVKKDNSRSLLNWVTSSESNNRGFEIQRSGDGINWTAIGFVPGAGNSANEQSYNFTDPSPQKGKNNYRLKQIDFDNKGKISEVRSITFAGDYTIVYPVPTADNIVIELKNSKLIGTRAVLSDQNGKVIRQIMITKMQQQVSLSSVPAGIYLLRMDDGSTHKLVKQ